MILKSSELTKNISASQVGGKAHHLLQLMNKGISIPPFWVIPFSKINEIGIDNLENNDEIKNWVNSLPSDKTFAVRSSANNEDGSESSFAGQFHSYLNIRKDDVLNHIKKVYHSSHSENVTSYNAYQKIKTKTEVSVIIQWYVDSDVSGVGFGVHPTLGDENIQVINSMYGLGEGIVSGKYDADEFIIRNGIIESKIVKKSLQLITNINNTSGLFETDVAKGLQEIPSLTDEQILKVAELLKKCKDIFNVAQDIEFAFYAGKIYLLQSRPITKIFGKSTSSKTNKIVWDNSNIIESYPNTTTPLTFSFISRSYELAYKNFSRFMGVDEKMIIKNENVFKNTLGFINGRVYYNLKSWYHMLAMLPGYNLNARFMEKMMGVKETFDVPEDLKLSKNAARWKIAASIFKMIKRHQNLKSERQKFVLLVNTTIQQYKAINYKDKTADEILHLYLQFEHKLLDNWKAPLSNDFFSMIWFGLLQKACVKLNTEEETNLHNDLLCGSSDIISTQPIHRAIEITDLIRENQAAFDLFNQEDEKLIWYILNEDEQLSNIKISVQRYIHDFGERCIGELKLETKSYTQTPQKFISILKSYILNNIKKIENKMDVEIRNKAEIKLNTYLGNNILKKWWFKILLSKTRELVSARENLRYERSRAFGIVRELFSQIGKKFSEQNILHKEEEIFYLTREEIISYIEGRSVSQDLKALVDVRKKENEAFSDLLPTAERITTYGVVYSNNDFYKTTIPGSSSKVLKGVGCCPGIIRGKARVVKNPNEIISLNGEILVTHSTDPGWVVLFPGASAIIVERGSLLSHSAIVSREMGKPCIVGITGLLSQIHTGDEIEIDGSKGTVNIITSVNNTVLDGAK